MESLPSNHLPPSPPVHFSWKFLIFRKFIQYIVYIFKLAWNSWTKFWYFLMKVSKKAFLYPNAQTFKHLRTRKSQLYVNIYFLQIWKKILSPPPLPFMIFEESQPSFSINKGGSKHYWLWVKHLCNPLVLLLPFWRIQW